MDLKSVRITLQRQTNKNKKARLYLHGPCYMDGLVSTGTNSLHNIKNNFF
jgi:hypothetical protein